MALQFKLAVWNAKGQTNLRDKLTAFLTYHSIDIMLISESLYTDKIYLNISDYTIYDTQHPDGMVSAIILKTRIKHHELLKYNAGYLQSTTITIEDWKA